jgi:four helix bundle protein
MAKDFTGLEAWQLAVELKKWVYVLARCPAVARDRDLVDQIVDAARSGPRNVAEGFGRFHRKEFAQFLKIAIASEQEVRNHILDAFDCGYITAAVRDEGVVLSKRAVAAALGLRKYLLSQRNPYR